MGGLLEMLLMLTSDAYRARVLQFVRDPIVKNYWEEVFPALAGQGKFLVQNLSESGNRNEKLRYLSVSIQPMNKLFFRMNK